MTPLKETDNKKILDLEQDLKKMPIGYYSMWNTYKPLFVSAPGSKTKHQAWHGGYKDHLLETFLIADRVFDTFNSWRALPFTLEQSKEVLFLHDLEKPFKYCSEDLINSEQLVYLRNLAKNHMNDDLIQFLVEKFSINLSKEQRNALKYVHGEGKDYCPDKRVMGELAAFVHVCDISSARIWFDYPEKDRTEYYAA